MVGSWSRKLLVGLEPFMQRHPPAIWREFSKTERQRVPGVTGQLETHNWGLSAKKKCRTTYQEVVHLGELMSQYF